MDIIFVNPSGACVATYIISILNSCVTTNIPTIDAKFRGV